MTVRGFDGATCETGVTKALGHLLVHYYFCVYCFTTGDYCGHCSSYNQFQRVAPQEQLAARQDHLEDAHLGELVEDVLPELRRLVATPLVIQIAVLAVQITLIEKIQVGQIELLAHQIGPSELVHEPAAGIHLAHGATTWKRPERSCSRLEASRPQLTRSRTPVATSMARSARGPSP